MSSKRMKKDLPQSSLPLEYKLLKSLSSSNSSPCSCIIVTLPFRNHSSSHQSSPDQLETEDLRGISLKAGIEIVRILDPEHREPFVSLSRIFSARSITTLEGLLTYRLRKPEFDLILAGVAPFTDIWVNLVTARRIATDLKVIDELAGFLEWETRLAWSVEDKEVGGLIHNWKISNEQILPDNYSTNSMLSTPFPRLHLLPKGTQVRTLLPEPINPSTPTLKPIHPSKTTFPTDWESLQSKIIEWTVHEFENYLSLQEEDSNLSTNVIDLQPHFNRSDSLDGELALTLGSIFTTSLAFLNLSRLLPEGSIPSNELFGSSILIGTASNLSNQSTSDPHSTSTRTGKQEQENFLLLERKEIVSSFLSSSSSFEEDLGSSERSKGVLGVCEFLGRLTINEWRREEEKYVEEERIRKGIEVTISKSVTKDLEERKDVVELELLRKRIEELEKKGEEKESHERSTSKEWKLGQDAIWKEINGLSKRIETSRGRGEESRNQLLEQSESWMVSARELNFILGMIVIGLIWSRLEGFSL